MRGTHERGASLAASLDALGDVEALVVDWNRNETTACQREGMSREPITRLLHPHRAPGVDERSGGDLERLLRTAHHHDLFRVTAQRPRGSEVTSDRFAEGLRPPLVSVVERLSVHVPTAPCHQLRPDLEREMIRSHLSYTKRSKAPPPGRRIETRNAQRGASDRPRT